ncbi:MAG: glycosyltransferase family 39 protein [Desulfomonile sp.]|nr:glycosyltransferase family 39 protein [Desulfomonile sp.]
MKRSTRLTYIASALVAVTFLAVSLFTLHNDHNWGDDFSMYILHAQNLFCGRDYCSGILMNYSYEEYDPLYATRTRPPLFPLALTPIIAVWGVDLFWLKIPNLLFWMLWVAVMYCILKRMLGKTHAVLLTLVLLFSPWFFRFKQQILTDVLFSLFVAAALLVYMRGLQGRERISARAFGLFVLLATLAALTRPAAHPLILAAILHLSLFERKYLLAGVLAAVWLVINTGGQLIGITDSVSFASYALGSKKFGVLQASWDHAVYTFSLIVLFLAPQYFPPFPILLVVLLALILLGFAVRVRSTAGFGIIEVFSPIYFAMLLAFPYPNGPRYILPIVGFLLAYSLIGLRTGCDFVSRNRWGAHAVTAVLVGTLLYCSAATWKDRGFNGGVLKSPPVQSLAAWVKENVGPDEHFLFRKPRALALLTGRTGLPTPKTPEEVRKICREQGVRWVILSPPWNTGIIKSLRSSSDFRYAWKYPGIHVFEYLLCSRQ